MTRIDPNTLYSLSELKEMLGDTVAVGTFLRRLGLKRGRIFRKAVWGFEILDAARDARSRPEAAISPVPLPVPPRPRGSRSETEPLTLEEVRTKLK
jgi:hypothetical protein